MPEVWPFIPLSGMRERLSFLTDVRRAAASEARTSLRDGRVLLDFEHVLDDAQNARAEALFAANAAGIWTVPHWGEAAELAAPVAPGATVLPAHAEAGWEVGGRVAVIGPDEVEAIEVVAVGGGEIELAAPTTISCDMVAPALACIAMTPLTGVRNWRGLSRRGISFLAVNVVAPEPPAYEVTGGFPVLSDPPRIVQPLDQVVDLGRRFLDNGSGLVEIEPARDILDRRTSVAFLDIGAAAMWRRKGMWHWLRGRDRAFWLPSFANDLQMTGVWASSAGVLSVVPVGLSPAALVGQWIAVEDSVGPIYRQVTAAAAVGSVWNLTVAAPGRDVPPSAVVSFLRLMRLDTDEVELLYTQRILFESAAVCVEVQG